MLQQLIEAAVEDQLSGTDIKGFPFISSIYHHLFVFYGKDLGFPGIYETPGKAVFAEQGYIIRFAGKNPPKILLFLQACSTAHLLQHVVAYRVIQLVQPALQDSHAFLKGGRPYRFQDIITDPGADGRPGIIKFLVTADDHGKNPRILLFYFFHQGNSVHNGHLHICDQHIRLKSVHLFQCFFPVIGTSDDLKLGTFQLYQRTKMLHCRRFILCNKNLVHMFPPSFIPAGSGPGGHAGISVRLLSAPA